MITFILALYSATLSTILLIRWVRLSIRRRNVRTHIKEENLSSEKQDFILSHPPSPMVDALSDMEEEGEAIRGFEGEMEREKNVEIEESVEEREWREEEKIKHRRESGR